LQEGALVLGQAAEQLGDAPALEQRVGVGLDRARVGPVTAKLTRPAADALNQAFGTTAFAEGLTIGTATVAAQGRVAPRRQPPDLRKERVRGLAVPRHGPPHASIMRT
jgi:hypothetical protein